VSDTPLLALILDLGSAPIKYLLYRKWELR